ncbi:MAG: TIGR03936 family radical SAM-associated protein [Tissierellia bacterium]|nr:TIGR03936 family radical SAM-associated protein [Tissierellia bacterium]
MCKIISKYTKTGNLKYISHLDVLRFIQRAVKRANIPAKYSEGFNPHMKTSFGFPLSLGNESIGEYFDLELNEKIDIDAFMKKMNEVLPKEMQITAAGYTNTDESIMSRCHFVQYLINIEFDSLDYNILNEYLNEMLETGIVYERVKKNKKNKNVTKELNTKDLIKYLNIRKNDDDNNATIEAVFLTTETGSIKTDEFMKLLGNKGFEITYYTIMKVDSLDKNMKTIL